MNYKNQLDNYTTCEAVHKQHLMTSNNELFSEI